MKKPWIVLIICLFAPLLLAAAEKLSTQELLDNLKSRRAGDRAKAARELGERGESLGLEALAEATTDRDEKVQMAVVEAISRINDPRQVSALSKAVCNTEGEAQLLALQKLTEHYMPPHDRPALLELWHSLKKLFSPPHPVTLEPWIEVDQEAQDAVLFVLQDKTSTNRIEAAATLGMLRIEKGIPMLEYFLQSPSEQMVRTCIRSLGYLGKTETGEALAPLLKHPNPRIAGDAAEVIGELSYAPAIPELKRLLNNAHDKDLRLTAFEAISRIADPSTEPLMKANLYSKDKDMRQFAIEGVGRMRLTGYKEVLQREFQREDSRKLKLALCFSLFAIGENAYIDTLVRSLDDRLYSDRVREYLIELGDPAVPKLAEYLKLSEVDFRLRVIRMLGEMRRTSAISYLEPHMKDADLQVAQAATDAIRELKKVQQATQTSD